MTEEFDCVVVGSGPGGYVGAIRAAQLGMKTALIEQEARVGGRCLNWACIPAKSVLRSADVVSEIRNAAVFGIEVGPPVVNFPAVRKRRDEVIATLGSGVTALLVKNKIELIKGSASLDVDGVVQVVERRLVGKRAVILATGSVRRALPGLAFGGRIIGTEEAWRLDDVPTSLAVIGAGASGVEIASAYARLGCAVELFEYSDRVLPTEDGDVSKVVQRGLESQGIKVHLNVSVSEAQSEVDKVTFTYGSTIGEADWLVVAIGRRPDVISLGIDKCGVALTNKGFISVDRKLRTSAPAIFAVGDLVEGPSLAHKASEEAVIAVETAAGNDVESLSHNDIPRVTFCSPNVGSVGLSEEAALGEGFDVVVGRVPYRAIGASAVYGDTTGIIKIVGERTYGSILGGHIVGTRATELIQEIVNAKLLEGGFSELARIIHGHPTMSEGMLEAARSTDGWVIHG